MNCEWKLNGSKKKIDLRSTPKETRGWIQFECCKQNIPSCESNIFNDITKSSDIIRTASETIQFQNTLRLQNTVSTCTITVVAVIRSSQQVSMQVSYLKILTFMGMEEFSIALVLGTIRH